MKNANKDGPSAELTPTTPHVESTNEAADAAQGHPTAPERPPTPVFEAAAPSAVPEAPLVEGYICAKCGRYAELIGPDKDEYCCGCQRRSLECTCCCCACGHSVRYNGDIAICAGCGLPCAECICATRPKRRRGRPPLVAPLETAPKIIQIAVDGSTGTLYCLDISNRVWWYRRSGQAWYLVPTKFIPTERPL